MEQKTNRQRSDQEWFDIITECRQSGLSDTQWCRLKGIARSTFSMAAKRLQQKSYALPESSESEHSLDIVPSQDVVPVMITQDPAGNSYKPVSEPVPSGTSMYLDNSHTIEITMNSISIRLTNNADPSLVSLIMKSLGGNLC